jgi:arylsulfatase
MHWPSGFGAKGEIESTPAHLIDVMPTVVAATGASYPKQLGSREILPMAGTNLLPVLQGSELPERTLYFEHEGHRAVREGRYKLTALREQPWQLFDIEADRTEMADLSSTHPEVAASLEKKWNTWAAENHVTPLPKDYRVAYLPKM